MIMVEIDSSVVLIKLMTSCKDAEMRRTHLALLQCLKWAGIVSKKHVLNNECLAEMKHLIKETCKLKLVPPTATAKMSLKSK